MSEKFSEGQMREAISVVAGSRGWFETREAWLARAARKAGISFRACKALWYGEITSEENKAARRMLDAATKEGRAEAKALASQFERIAGSLNVTDADFHSADVAALLDAARALRGLDRARTDGEG